MTACPAARLGPVILLVEDNSDDVEIIRLAFARTGMPQRLVTAGTGRDAMKYIGGAERFGDRSRFPWPDLILLDLSLPEMDGLEVLTWMQGERPDAVPPTFVLSSSQDEGDKRLAKKFGAKGYFVKSPDLDETVAMIRNLLETVDLCPG